MRLSVLACVLMLASCGGSPAAPTARSGGIRSDSITIPHEVVLGSPTPTSSQSTMYCCWPLPIANAGQYAFTLNAFPMDDLPSGGGSNRVSPSEMVMVAIKFGTPTTQSASITWHRQGTSLAVWPIATNTGAAYAYIGRFHWEIVSAGQYDVTIDTEWGSVTVDFSVF